MICGDTARPLVDILGDVYVLRRANMPDGASVVGQSGETALHLAGWAGELMVNCLTAPAYVTWVGYWHR